MRCDTEVPDDLIEKVTAFVEREAGRDAPLTQADEDVVRQLIEDDPTMRTLADDLRSTNAALNELLTDCERVEVPKSLVDFIQSHGAPPDFPEEPEMQTVFPLRRPSPPLFQRISGPLAVAASLAALMLAGTTFVSYQANVDLRADVTSLQVARLSLDGELAAARSEASSLSKQFAIASSDLREKQAELSAAENARHAAVLTLARTEAELEAVRSVRDQFAKQLASQEDRANESDKNKAIEVGRLQDDVERLEAAVRDAGAARALAEAEAGRTRASLKSLTKDASKLRETVASLRAEATRMKGERDDSQRELDLARSALVHLEQEVADLSAVNDSLNAELGDLNLGLADRAASLIQTEEQLAQLTRERDRLAGKDNEHRSRIIDLEADLNSARARFARLSAEADGSSWLDQVAGYHLGYAGQQREVEVSAADELTQWLGSQLRRDIDIPDLTDEGLEFIGGRLFFIDGEPVGQIAYHDNEGRLTGFCITPNRSQKTAPLTRYPAEELNMIGWQDQSFKYALVGFEDFEAMQPLARRLMTKYGSEI